MDESKVRPEIEMFRSESKELTVFAGVNITDMTKAELLITAAEIGHMYARSEKRVEWLIERDI